MVTEQEALLEQEREVVGGLGETSRREVLPTLDWQVGGFEGGGRLEGGGCGADHPSAAMPDQSGGFSLLLHA